ncbi:MAG: ABC transporter substrate-binding protein [Magnetococcus sp. YQC-5]
MKKNFAVFGFVVCVGFLLRLFVWPDKSELPSTPSTPLRIAIDIWTGSAHAFLAEKKGLFAKNGVVVQLIAQKGPSENQTAFKNGEVDGVIGGVFSDVILLHAEGYLAKVVYVTDYSESGDVILGRPGLNSLADLKGHTVSFDTLNSFSHIFVLKALKSYGLNEASVRFELVQAPDVLKALEEGRIDAGHTWQPTTTHALAKGYKILAKASDFKGTITDTLYFHPKIIIERPKEVLAMIRSLLEAKQYLTDHKEESLAIMAKAINMSIDELSMGLDEIKQANLSDNLTAFTNINSPYSLYQSGNTIIQFLLQRGALQDVPDLTELLDDSFIQSIQKEKHP